MMQNIGYPDWIMNNSELDKYNDLKQVAMRRRRRMRIYISALRARVGI